MTPNATTISNTTNNGLININMSVNDTTTKSGGALPSIGGWGLVPTFNSNCGILPRVVKCLLKDLNGKTMEFEKNST